MLIFSTLNASRLSYRTNLSMWLLAASQSDPDLFFLLHYCIFFRCSFHTFTIFIKHYLIFVPSGCHCFHLTTAEKVISAMLLTYSKEVSLLVLTNNVSDLRNGCETAAFVIKTTYSVKQTETVRSSTTSQFIAENCCLIMFGESKALVNYTY